MSGRVYHLTNEVKIKVYISKLTKFTQIECVKRYTLLCFSFLYIINKENSICFKISSLVIP